MVSHALTQDGLNPEFMELSEQELKDLLLATTNKAADDNPSESGKSLLERLEDRASMKSKLQKCQQETARDAEVQEEEEDEENVHAGLADGGYVPAPAEQVESLPAMPQDEDEVPEQPKTLVDVLKAASAKKEACFDLAESSGAGEVACLRRVACMLGPIRQLVRFTRLEEGLLSLAWVEHGQDLKLNRWNQAAHDVAMSRLVLNLSKSKLSRAVAWQGCQEKLCRTVTSKNKEASDADPGMLKVEKYAPPLDPRAHMVNFHDMVISIDFSHVLQFKFNLKLRRKSAGKSLPSRAMPATLMLQRSW